MNTLKVYCILSLFLITNLDINANNNTLSFCHPDLAVLVTLYNATDGANWTANTGWVDGAAGTNCVPCDWYGVICDNNDRVTKLHLGFNNLVGTIPSTISDLTNLIE